MVILSYRILGYNLDFGVVRIEGESLTAKDVVIFPSQCITGELRLGPEEVLFISKKGEGARLNLRTAEVTHRTKLFPFHNSINRLFLLPKTSSIISVTDHAITLINGTSLQVTKIFNAVLRDETGQLKLKHYDDIKAPFEAKAAAEWEAFIASKKSNPEGPWLKREWHWASELKYWPINRGDALKPQFDGRHAALRQDGRLIIPYSKTEGRISGKDQSERGLGLAYIDVLNETIVYTPLDGFGSTIPHHLTFKAISADGTGLLVDRHSIARRVSQIGKAKKWFQLGKTDQAIEFEHYFEIWNIENQIKFDRHISVRRMKARLEPTKPSQETKQKYPSLYESQMREEDINSCRLDAAKVQFSGLSDTLTWSADKFKSDFHANLLRRKINIDRNLEKELERGHFPFSAAGGLLVEAFMDFALAANPEFLQKWLNTPLTNAQAETLTAIKTALRRVTQNASCFEWASLQSDIHFIDTDGKLSVCSTDNTKSGQYKLEHLETEGKELSKRDISRNLDNQLLVETAQAYGSARQGLCCKLPLKFTHRNGRKIIPTDQVYDADSFQNDHKRAETLSRKARRGFVTIRSTSPAHILQGLQKLTEEYRRHHEEMVLSSRWDAGLYHKNNLVLEHEIAKILTETKDPTAIPVLNDFVETVMHVSVKDGVTISPYPRDQTTGHVHWRVWHNDDGTQVGMPSVNALIALSKTVPEIALTFYRHSDFEHDAYTTDKGLPQDVLPYVELSNPGFLKLLAINAFQLLATGRVGDDLFAQHGMERVSLALENGDLSPKLAAQVFVDEVKGLEGALSWGNNLGPHGLVAQAVYGLDKSSTSKQAFGEAMLNIYPEARIFLDNKMAG